MSLAVNILLLISNLSPTETSNETRPRSIDLIEPDPEQPRKIFDRDRDTELKENIERIGQQVPGIGYQCAKNIRLLDGERRWRALRAAGKEDMTLILLSEMPTKAQLQLSRPALTCIGPR